MRLTCIFATTSPVHFSGKIFTSNLFFNLIVEKVNKVC
nr:MAG TPA: hypothetical protein [Caudoviricetes sp.]